MTKDEAIALLGGTSAAVARAIGITRAAVAQWKVDEHGQLHARTADRVMAAKARLDAKAAASGKRRRR